MLAADVQESTLGKKSEDSMWRREPWDLLITTYDYQNFWRMMTAVLLLSPKFHIFFF